MSNEIHDFVGSPQIVMPDVIRHPEHIEFAGSGLHRDGGKRASSTFYGTIKHANSKSYGGHENGAQNFAIGRNVSDNG